MVTSCAIRDCTDRTGPLGSVRGVGKVPSATHPPVARLSAKSWISRFAYLVSRSYSARNSSTGVSG